MAKPSSKSERATRTTVDTILFSRDAASKWKLPPFQRPLRVNEKVRELSRSIAADGGIVPGIMTFGNLKNDVFLLDGQHRREAFLMSEKDEGFADTRTCYFDSMAEMGEEYVRLNSQLVKMRPDDMLRGLEGSLPLLSKIREGCPFVGYDMIRHSSTAPMVSMAVALRCWEASKSEVPTAGCTSATIIASNLQEDEAKKLVKLLHTFVIGFGRDVEYMRLWTALNMTLCMWLYRRMVLTAYSKRTIKIDDGIWTKGMMSLSANGNYIDWLVGRKMGERDRGPAYTKITTILKKRLEAELGKQVTFPRPPWAATTRSSTRRVEE